MPSSLNKYVYIVIYYAKMRNRTWWTERMNEYEWCAYRDVFNYFSKMIFWKIILYMIEFV